MHVGRSMRESGVRTDDHDGELNTLLNFVSSASACERHGFDSGWWVNDGFGGCVGGWRADSEETYN